MLIFYDTKHSFFFSKLNLWSGLNNVSSKCLCLNLNFQFLSVTLSENSIIAEVMLLQEDGPLIHVTDVPIKVENLEIDMHTGRMSCEDEGRD